MNDQVVVLTVPADAAYVSTVRLTAASVAARSDLTIDEVDDLRLAVDEACSILLPHAASPDLEVHFTVGAGTLTAVVSIGIDEHDETTELDRGGIGWALLEALTTTVQVQRRPRTLALVLCKQRQAAGR